MSPEEVLGPRYTIHECDHALPNGMVARSLIVYDANGEIGYMSLKLIRPEGQSMLDVVTAFEHAIDTVEPDAFQRGRYIALTLVQRNTCHSCTTH